MSLTLTWAWSFALDDGVLPEEATEAGLLGAASFFRTRDLSRPFSGGEWAGLTRGVAGSYGVKRDRQRARLSKQTGGKPLACTCRSNKLGPHVQTQINILVRARTLPHTHTLFIHLSLPFLFVFFVLFSAWMAKEIQQVSTHSWRAHTHTHTTNIMTDFLATLWKVLRLQQTNDKREPCLVCVQRSHCGMWLSSSVQTQSYLIGNIHHQVVTFVSVTVLKWRSVRLSVLGDH